MNSADQPAPAGISEFARVMSECVPELAAASSIGIVATSGSTVRQIGSGTLLAVADLRFVVTAAHVIRDAVRLGGGVGFSGAPSGHFTAATEQWMVSVGDTAFSADESDVALYCLNTEQIARLEGAQYVRISDASFSSDLSGGYFVVTGFPAVWSTVLGGEDTTMRTKLLQYGTYSFQGSLAALDNFNSSRHFLLEANPSGAFDQTGSNMTFRTRTGYPARMPADLGGVSGCSVWMIGNLSVATSCWTKDAARIVGLQTGVYPQRSAIKASRWNVVTTLLHKAYPSIRSAVELYA